MDRNEYMREYYRRPGVAEKVRARAKAYREANIEKVREYDRARGYRGTTETALAHNRARVLEPQSCVECGSTENIEGHHPDYSKPLEVVWLCRTHHRTLHRRVV